MSYYDPFAQEAARRKNLKDALMLAGGVLLACFVVMILAFLIMGPDKSPPPREAPPVMQRLSDP